MVEPTQKVPSDATLIRRARKGEVDAFGELYKRYLERMYRYIRMRVDEDQTAEDLTETVFLRAFEALDTYQERGHPFSAFLYQIARNLLADHYRKPGEELGLEVIGPVASEDADPHAWAMGQERRAALKQALEALPKHYQEVIRLRVLMGLSSTEVADWLGRSPGATRVLLHRALKAMRRALEDEDDTRD